MGEAIEPKAVPSIVFLGWGANVITSALELRLVLPMVKFSAVTAAIGFDQLWHTSRKWRLLGTRNWPSNGDGTCSYRTCRSRHHGASRLEGGNASKTVVPDPDRAAKGGHIRMPVSSLRRRDASPSTSSPLLCRGTPSRPLLGCPLDARVVLMSRFVRHPASLGVSRGQFL
jgi:hypothetical protein